MKARVAALRVQPQSILEASERLFDLADVEAALSKSATTIVKPDVSLHFPFPAANTTPWQLEGCLRALRAHGQTDVAFVQGSSVTIDDKRTLALNAYEQVLARYNAPALVTGNRHDMTWVEYRPKAQMRTLHRIFPDGIRVPDYFFGKNVVQLPTLKCHAFTTVGGAALSTMNGLLSEKRHYAMSDVHLALVDVLAISREISAGTFCFADGTTAGSGAGPRTLQPHEKGIVLAGKDSVAVDAVAAKLMGFDPMSIPYLKLAQTAGLGVCDPRDIELVGDDVSGEDWNFQATHNRATRLGQALWFGGLKSAQKALLRGPLSGALAFGSELYYDAYRWRQKDRAVFEAWKQTSPWGQLFAAYERGETDKLIAPR